jgi:hypothetical protein
MVMKQNMEQGNGFIVKAKTFSTTRFCRFTLFFFILLFLTELTLPVWASGVGSRQSQRKKYFKCICKGSSGGGKFGGGFIGGYKGKVIDLVESDGTPAHQSGIKYYIPRSDAVELINRCNTSNTVLRSIRPESGWGCQCKFTE